MFGNSFLHKDHFVKDKNYFYLVYVFIAVVIASFRGIQNPWGGSADGLSPVSTVWLFDYEYGFTKRGLNGEIFKAIFGGISKNEVLLSYFILLTVMLSLIFLFLYVFLPKKLNQTTFLLVMWFITNTGLIQQRFWDIGHTDIYGSIFVLLSAILIFRIKSVYLVSIFTSLICIISIMIHEGFFLWVYPACITFIFLKKEKVFTLEIFTVSFVSFLSVLFVGTSSPNISENNYLSYLKETSSVEVNDFLVGTLFRPLSQSLEMGLGSILSFTTVFDTILLAICSFPVGYTLYKLSSRIGNSIELGLIKLKESHLLILCWLAPLSLYILGWDHGRWWSMAMTNMASISIVLVYKYDIEELTSVLYEYRNLLFVGVMINLLLGPPGFANAFPESHVYRVFEVLINSV